MARVIPPRGLRREAFYAVLAVVSVLIGIARIGNPAPPALWVQGLDVLIAGAFLADWVRRIHGASRRWRYALTHSYEVVFFIPFTVFAAGIGGGDLLRAARLLRFVRYVSYGRYARLSLALWRLPRRVRHLQRVAVNAQLVAILVAGLVVVNLGAAALLVVEGPLGTVRDYAGALWWSLNMFTTVAYDVPPPQTATGRVVTGTLMVLGVAYIGVLTASLASALLTTDPEEE